MYAVFLKTFKTAKGKAIVQAHEADQDAQKIYKEYCDYATKSTAASLDADNLLAYLTTSRIDDGLWKGNTETYILNWMECM